MGLNRLSYDGDVMYLGGKMVSKVASFSFQESSVEANLGGDAAVQESLDCWGHAFEERPCGGK